MEYTYSKLNKIRKPKKVEKLPSNGTWVPLSIAAHIKNHPNGMMIRWQYLNGEIQCIKFPVGPLLVNLDDIKSNH